jgi:hypothetical protein
MTQIEAREFTRAYLIDFDSENLLLEFSEENGNTQLDFYVMMALSKVNAVPPFLAGVNFGIEDFPMPELIIHAAALECLKSQSIRQARNDITYNNSGISVKMHDGQRYNTQLQFLEQTVQQEIENWRKQKVAININRGYGGTWSPYATLNGRRPV